MLVHAPIPAHAYASEWEGIFSRKIVNQFLIHSVELSHTNR